MLETFRDCTSFNREDLNTWNVARVTTLSCTFYGATSFDQDLSSWNVPSVENVKKKLLHLAVESNVDEFSTLSKMVKVPAFFQECNYVGDKRGAFIHAQPTMRG